MIDPSPFEIETETHDATATVSVRGDLDIASIQRLERVREQLLAGQARRLRLDLRRVEFVDSSGLKFLIDTALLSRQDGWILEILQPDERAMRVFEITGAIEHLPFVEGAGDADGR